MPQTRAPPQSLRISSWQWLRILRASRCAAKVLRDADLVEREIEGPRTCHWASREQLARMHALLGEMREDAVELDRSVSAKAR